MTTEIINLWEYRKNISSLWKRSKELDIKYIVLVHWEPAFEVNPIYGNTFDDEWDTIYTEENHKAYLEAMEDLENGNVTEIDLDKAQTFEWFINQLKG
jgi:hypothetical protein